jgi:hypothetical protein
LDAHHQHYRPPPAPLTESLRDCQRRVVDYFTATIQPALMRENQTGDTQILLVAHSNTLRGLMAHLDETPEHKIANSHVPNSVPCVYSFDATTGTLLPDKNVNKQWMWSYENYERLQAKVSSQEYIQSLLESVKNHDGNDDYTTRTTISKQQLEQWLVDQMGNQDISMGALAGKLWEEVSRNGTTHYNRCNAMMKTANSGRPLSYKYCFVIVTTFLIDHNLTNCIVVATASSCRIGCN